MVEFSRFVSSSHGGNLLVDTDGFIYNQKNKLKSNTTYTCRRAIKNKKTVNLLLQCPAKLTMFSEIELVLDIPHNHYLYSLVEIIGYPVKV